MLRLTADPADGALVTWAVFPHGAGLPPAGPSDLDLDETTNPTLVAALDQDGRSFRLVGGALSRNGQPFTINPPGAAETEKLTPANVSAVLDQLQAFRDAASLSNAQRDAAIKLLCRIAQFMIRRLVAG
jgi:hypothetical protein